MRTLAQSLQDRDLGFLRLIQEQWNLDLRLRERKSGSEQLAQGMLGSNLQLDRLLPESREVLEALLRNGGIYPLSALIRQFGQLREMGQGKRDREEPWLKPISPLEELWYRGLLFRAFLDSKTGPQEFAYIPIDLIPLLPELPAEIESPLGHARHDPEWKVAVLPSFFDDAITLLAGMRKAGSGFKPHSHIEFFLLPEALDLLVHLLLELGVITGPTFKLVAEALPQFLQDEAVSHGKLIEAWKTSPQWNDLAQITHLQPAADSWPNDPLVSRSQILAMLEPIPKGIWWSLDGFIKAVRKRQPDFQRPAGDFESWIFQDSQTREAVHGFDAWEQVDGALLRYVLCGPLHWLGVIDLGVSRRGEDPESFRVADFMDSAFNPTPFRKGRIRLNAAGEFQAESSVRPDLRYQIARFCDWVDTEPDTYRYKLTPAALQSASEQGLGADQVVRILTDSLERDPPAHITNAIERWFVQGSEIQVEHDAVITVKHKKALKELQENPRTARFIQKVIGPKSFTVRPRELEAFIQSALRASILIELNQKKIAD